MIIAVIIGSGMLILRNRKGKSPRTMFGWLGSIVGLLLIGTGAITFYQMVYSIIKSSLVPEVAITLIFALVPLVLGLSEIIFSIRGERTHRSRYRVYVAVIGVAGIFIWAGLYIGPILAIITSFLPFQRGSKSENS
jgi:membrane protein CcdC involved in cytochrome C biogenesis